jgi:ubiquinone/menaquinone biosynthesis C-methylase UbiE
MADRPMRAFDFRLMSFLFRVRDLLRPRRLVLAEVGIQPGFSVLDYGCGPGSYLVPLSKLVGETGRIYALDIHPLALERVRRIATRRGLANVETILSACETGLPDASIDVVLLYDTFHGLSEGRRVLQELHRVLKADGFLSFSDHHMRESEILTAVVGSGRYRLARQGEKTYTFEKV